MNPAADLSRSEDVSATATAAGPRAAAFYALALDTSMRKGDLCGLRWSDLDLDAGKVRVVRQLAKQPR